MPENNNYTSSEKKNLEKFRGGEELASGLILPCKRQTLFSSVIEVSRGLFVNNQRD